MAETKQVVTAQVIFRLEPEYVRKLHKAAKEPPFRGNRTAWLRAKLDEEVSSK